ncbi:MaoC family dehydratase [Emcibacter sp.]|uniref:MaoC family dehydratase n=1 Tax=Emcibacter sp. TaxID=1979954 RepID=UPI002AA7A7E6|nr:MaoC family dehydratase [Emcibacter sp.]
MRCYEDLSVGEERLSPPATLTEKQITDFASLYDPQWFHADPEAAQNSFFNGIIASGIHTLALWRQLDHKINNDIDFVCGIGWDEVRWPVPVRPGDSLRAKSRILEKYSSRSRDDRGHVKFEYSVINQRNEIVLSMTSHNLVYRKGHGHPEKLHVPRSK